MVFVIGRSWIITCFMTNEQEHRHPNIRKRPKNLTTNKGTLQIPTEQKKRHKSQIKRHSSLRSIKPYKRNQIVNSNILRVSKQIPHGTNRQYAPTSQELQVPPA